MATGAIDGQRFEVHQALIVLGARNVARLASHVFMPAAQRKAAVFFVVKLFGKPIETHMAGGAVGGLAVGGFARVKLAAVNIIVASGTVG